MGYPCRCNKRMLNEKEGNVFCSTRITLPKHPSEYVRPPKCKACGSPVTYVCVDRLARQHGKKKKCNCTGYWFQHRKGSKWCHYNPDIEQVHMEFERRQAA